VMYEKPYEDYQEAKFLSGWFESEHIHRDVWPEWVKEHMDERQTSKTVGFGINYGEGDRALAAKLNISLEEAEARKARYFKPYPKVKEFIELTHMSCRETLEVHTLLGAKRRLLDADADWKEGYYNYKQRRFVPERPGKLAARALRQAVNTIIQGTAGEIAKLAQLRCHNDDYLRNRGVKQLLQIHDEILFEVPNEVLPECCDRITKLMEKPFADVKDMLGLDFDCLTIPLGVDIGMGEAWSEAH
jgi:DNA polymerase-1